MPTDHRAELRSIRTFPSLVRYLRDEMDWPIGTDDFEELTFEYTPEELGIDAASAARIQEIKRLRPLSANQPWGIFFVKFEPKRLPVVALRRILSRVVLKKRASANSAERAAWKMDDLLFVSNYGQQDDRRISLAYFTQDEEMGDLPTLRVLGWDGDDTNLHLDYVAKELQTKLRWPADDRDVDAWRATWGSAFTLRNREVITTSKRLAERLAEIARAIRRKANDALAIESSNGPLRRLMAGFQKALIHDLTEDDFADMYAQTIAYGLLSARVSRPAGLVADNMADLVPITNPFLKELLETFLRLGGRRRNGSAATGIDFDELGINEVVQLLRDANMGAVLRDFGDRNPQEDPVIHFYELFLKEYDAKKRMQRGVFYTPRPVVSYIVRSVHELLQTEFGLADGLADTATWGEMASRHAGLSIPQGVKPTDRFVTILDPAAGTGTFLVEAIDVIHRTLVEKWRDEGHSERQIIDLWNSYVPEHLLPRLHGYELLMAPYAIAHLKIGLKLHETGYSFESNERARIYLTNALEPAGGAGKQMGFAEWLPALAHEAEAVNAVKGRQHFTVVVGNPPYSGFSANMSDAIMALVEPYKAINGVSLGERKIWAQDDYKKFVRFSQLRISDAGSGIVGLITNHGYISEPTGRGMRHSLLGTFDSVSVVDLHGSLKKRETCPDGSPDKNVFDIEPGVAISVLRRTARRVRSVSHADLWGLREAKYDHLLSHTSRTTEARTVSPAPEFYLFVPQSAHAEAEFSRYTSVKDVFLMGSNGIQTSRDDIVYAFEKDECRRVIEEFRASEAEIPTRVLRDRYWPGKRVANYASGDTRGWSLPEARRHLRGDGRWLERLRHTLYRPFDWRALLYADYMIDWPRLEVMKHMLAPNLSLCIGRAGSAADNQDWNIVFVANTLVDMNLFYRGGNISYPLWLLGDRGGLAWGESRRSNFNAKFLQSLAQALNLRVSGEHGLPQNVTPEGIFNFIYAVFHSPEYRTRYAEALKIDFARLPLPSSLQVFHEMERLGSELVQLHLVEEAAQRALSARYDVSSKQWRYEVAKGRQIPIELAFGGPEKPVVSRVGWSNETVWIDAVKPKKAAGDEDVTGTVGFHGVPEDVWDFHIGGYQVCEKWLKDRKGRVLTAEDITHYHRIVIALHETIRIMGEIDQVIDRHGGWPGAFAGEQE